LVDHKQSSSLEHSSPYPTPSPIPDNVSDLLAQTDFKAMGFKCGLEIHQQINTKQKLFCRCPTVYRNDDPDRKVLRHMRPTMSEMGVYDGTALMEFKTHKEVIYELFNDSVCTYESDDTPPFPLNQLALDVGLRIAMMLECQIVDEVHVSRKQYLDGSIPTGFQRTMILGVEGKVPYKDREIDIIQLALEEDACREMSDIGHRIVFRTDRLSIPLVEVVTYPQMETPKEATEVANLLGRLLRASGVVRRGLGSTRQDVNVSIDGSTRVEIKGVPKYQYIERLTAVEAVRHRQLLEIRDALGQRNIAPETLQTEIHDVGDLFAQTNRNQIKESLKSGGSVLAICLRDILDILEWPTQPGRTFTHEIAGRVRVIACLDDVPNILMTGSVKDFQMTEEEVNSIKGQLGLENNDVVVVVWGPQKDTATAVQEIRIRCQEAAIGVPSETRQAFPEGITDFERILPGPDRMYPDTDTPPTPISNERVDGIKNTLPSLPWEREKWYSELGIPEATARILAISDKARLFEQIMKEKGLPPTLVAVTLIETMKALKRDDVSVEKIKDEDLSRAFISVSNGKLAKEGLPPILRMLARGEPFDEVLSRFSPIDKSELLTMIGEIKDELGEREGKKALNFVMGKVMETARGRMDGRKVAQLVNKILELGLEI